MIVRSIVAFGSDFEHSAVSINWVIHFKTRLNWDIPGYPRLCISFEQGYPVISHLVLSYPSRDIPGYPEISQDKILVLGYPITSFLFWVIPGYPGINTRSGYPGISLDIPCDRFSRWLHNTGKNIYRNLCKPLCRLYNVLSRLYRL